MSKKTVWTKQHINILSTLEQQGRHIAKQEYIVEKMQDISKFYLDVYNWYTEAASKFVPKPEDVSYPIWVSLSPDSTLVNDEDTVVLEMKLDDSDIIEIDFDKWGLIVNYCYIPDGQEDLRAHQKLLDNYGIDDARAYMSGYYPAIKKKILKSWDRLFQIDTLAENAVRVGTIWEIREEWIKNKIW